MEKVAPLRGCKASVWGNCLLGHDSSFGDGSAAAVAVVMVGKEPSLAEGPCRGGGVSKGRFGIRFGNRIINPIMNRVTENIGPHGIPKYYEEVQGPRAGTSVRSAGFHRFAMCIQSLLSFPRAQSPQHADCALKTSPTHAQASPVADTARFFSADMPSRNSWKSTRSK